MNISLDLNMNINIILQVLVRYCVSPISNEDIEMDVVKLNIIGKEIIRRTTRVREIANVLQESRLIWYKHTMRREVE